MALWRSTLLGFLGTALVTSSASAQGFRAEFNPHFGSQWRFVADDDDDDDDDDDRRRSRSGWEQFYRGLRSGDIGRSGYSFRLPFGARIEFGGNYRDGYYRDDYYDDRRWYDERPYRYRDNVYRDSYYPRDDYYSGGYYRDRGQRRYTAQQLARSADRLLERLQDSHLEDDWPELVESAERFADAADDYHQEIEDQRGGAWRELREVRERWRILDRRLSQLSPRYYSHERMLGRQVDRYLNELERY